MLSLSIHKKMKSFEINANFNVTDEITILSGPSGAGKTTILNCIAGLNQPDSGHIILNEHYLFYKGRKAERVQKRNIGYLFQDYALFPHMTVEGNIRYGMKNEELLSQLIHASGISHLLSDYPSQISGGEKQRVALVRALATEPEALLLDEPFSSLDHQTKLECQNELLRLHAMWHIPVILVTHNEQEVKKLGDRILTIEDGQII